MLILGSHVSLGGKDQYLGSVREAIVYGGNAFMVYTGAPQNTIRKPVSTLKIPEAWTLMTTHGIDKGNIVVHAPYIVNLANPEPDKRAFAIAFLTEEIRRTHALGAKTLVMHPGSHLGQGVAEGTAHIAAGLAKMIEDTAALDVRIALEGMAGKGTEIGRTFAELAAIIDQTAGHQRLGVCLDTCHSYDAGYDIRNDFDGVLEEFADIVGLDRLLVFHVNDSKNLPGSGKDRHENIGFGKIGFAALMAVINHRKLAEIPKILETPFVPSVKYPEKGYPPYQHEIAMIKSGVFDPNLKQKIIDANEVVAR